MLRTLGTGLLFSLLALACLGVALASTRYLFDGPGLSDFVLANANAVPWLKLHVAGGVIALALAPWQFLARLRVRWPRLHRRLGQVYVVACLFGGVAGMVLAIGTVQGPIAQSGFAGLALAWLVTTAIAWRRAVTRRFRQHGEWMIRSFAMTLAAVTLRLYLPIPPALGYDFDTGYRAIAWLCWVPNLLVAEIVVRSLRNRPLLGLPPVPRVSSSASSPPSAGGRQPSRIRG